MNMKLFNRFVFAVCSRRFKVTTASSQSASPPTALARELSRRIRLTGPLTLADFTRECLLHPRYGYYSSAASGVFGDKGDFVTSPELCQIFGELIGVWILHGMLSQSEDAKFELIELGPGTGRMMNDILRTFSKLRQLDRIKRVSLIDASPTLAQRQRNTLAEFTEKVEISWENSIESYLKASAVRKTAGVFIAHEFFDALPIHKFQRVSSLYREVLVDVDGEDKFRYVLSTGPTAASTAFLDNQTGDPSPQNDDGKIIEVCPSAISTVQVIAQRIAEYGAGLALFADYGYSSGSADTFRAYKRHLQVDPLIPENIGQSDLTADVDFGRLCRSVKRDGIRIEGPLAQNEFLTNMGYYQRLKVLIGSSSDKQQRDRLEAASDILMSPKQMGSRFKFMALLPSNLSTPVAGFCPAAS